MSWDSSKLLKWGINQFRCELLMYNFKAVVWDKRNEKYLLSKLSYNCCFLKKEPRVKGGHVTNNILFQAFGLLQINSNIVFLNK